MEKRKTCDLCKNTSFVTVYKEMEDRLHHVKGASFSILRCEICDLHTTDPFLSTEEDFKTYYPGHYYSYNPPAKKDVTTKIALFLYNLFYNPKERMNPFRYLLFPVSYFVRGTKIIKNGKLLDIGCGAGFFLRRMKDLGMMPYGIELGKQGFEACQKMGIRIWNTPVFKAGITSDYFDVITINSVLEHIAEVHETLKACHCILKKDGVLIIQVPNKDGFSAKYFKQNWAEWDIPRHITHFSKKTLVKYLKDCGFAIKKIKNTGSAFQFTQSLIYKYPKLEKLFKKRI